MAAEFNHIKLHFDFYIYIYNTKIYIATRENFLTKKWDYCLIKSFEVTLFSFFMSRVAYMMI